MKLFKIGKVEQEYYDTIGSKAKGLDLLKRLGYNVPDGFIIYGVDETLGGESRALTYLFDKMNLTSVATRASASFENERCFYPSGQYETCLFVNRTTLVPSILRCVKSLNNNNVLAYNNLYLKEKKNTMNVVVQEMVKSRFSGVFYSECPFNPDFVLVEAIKGVGKKPLVDSSKPDQFLLPKTGYQKQVERKELNNTLLAKIYNEGMSIKERFGYEVDLEWAIDDDDNLYWLQVRPIAQLSAKIDDFNPAKIDDNSILTSHQVDDILPRAITPLSISTVARSLDASMKNSLKKIGGIKNSDSYPDYSFISSIDGHLFIDLTSVYSLNDKLNGSDDQSINVALFGNVCGDLPRENVKRASAPSKWIKSFKINRFISSAKSATKKQAQIINKLTFDKTPTLNGIYNSIDVNLNYVTDILNEYAKTSACFIALHSALYKTLCEIGLGIGEYQNFTNKILKNVNGVESADILFSLQKLAYEMLQVNPYFKDRTPEELLKYLTTTKHENVAILYRQFLAKHGHRSIKEAELRSKSLRNDQISLMKYLHAVLVATDPTIEPSNNLIPENLTNLFSNVANRKGKLKSIAKKLRKTLVNREASKSKVIKVIDTFKSRYAILSELMAKEQLLEDPDLIYFLSHKEIGSLIGGNYSLNAKARARREVFEKQNAISFKKINVGKPEEQEVQSLKRDSIKGIAVLDGKVTGKAKLVETIEDAEKLTKDDVMIVRDLDIGWTPYYSTVAGLIAETGTPSSHGAVVAREYALPTVVNAKSIFSAVQNGDVVTIDGNSGKISID